LPGIRPPPYVAAIMQVNRRRPGLPILEKGSLYPKLGG
jgi:hypothetical protein